MPPKRSKRGDADPFWEWVHEDRSTDSLTEEHIHFAYRLNQTPCKLGKCRKNCRQNPFCLNGLGEQSWLKSEVGNALDSFLSEECLRREQGALVGLRNLGATCYFNAFLQLWFHNRAFRAAVYEWRGEEPSPESSVAFPTTICGLLQYIFASLELSKMSVVDPSPLVRKLMLNNLEQQDAQEFGKLFMTLLGSLPDDRSSTSCGVSANKLLKARIQEIFSGDCQYVTRCHSCNTQSAANSSYTEIDAPVEGKRTLAEALADYLKEEELDGDNMYHCAVCNTKRKASRRIQLKSVPPVLHLQLLRYVYDRKAGQKKKICSPIQFPEVLCMGRYLGSGEDSDVYDLSAVLVHSGSGAYYGHYTAHIRVNVADISSSTGEGNGTSAHDGCEPSQQDQPGNSSSYVWYKFNDEAIEPISSPNAELSREENKGRGEVKSEKAPKGYLSSKNAYMLVYKRRQCSKDLPHSTADVPHHIRSIVEKENNEFVATITEVEIQARQKKESEAAVKDYVAKTYMKLFTSLSAPVTLSPNNVVAISSLWLSEWLKNPDTAGDMDNGPFLCHHGKINVNELTNLKYISQLGASAIYEKYGVNPRLDLSMTCTECVKQISSYKRMQTQITQDLQLISDGLKSEGKISVSDGYLVGKDSVRHLKSLMMRPLAKAEVLQPATAALQARGDGRPDGQSGDHNAGEVNGASGTLSGESKFDFNDDLLCCHGSLAIDEKKRMVIARVVWEALRKHFPAAPEFPAESQPCTQCLDAEAEAKESATKHRVAAMELRGMLCDLLGNKRRPQPFDDQEVFLVSRTFVESLKNFTSTLRKTEAPVPQVKNELLLCTHGNLSADPSDADVFVTLWPHEWLALWKYFGECERAICVKRSVPPADHVTTLNNYDRTCYTVSPEICSRCLSAHLAIIDSRRFTYNFAKLYVSKIGGSRPPQVEQKESDDKDAIVSGSNSNGNCPDASSSDENARKRQKTAHPSADSSSQPTAATMATLRRSNRRCRSRAAKEVIVSSGMTLKQLKVELMKHFSVAPFDQTLLLDGRVLEPDHATLHDLCIEPSSVLQLQVDEVCTDDASSLEALLVRSGVQEEGFKGTGLLAQK